MADKENQTDTEEEEIVMVGPGAEAEQTDEGDDNEEEQREASEQSDETEEEDERAGHAEDEEGDTGSGTPSEKQLARREERRRKRERQRERMQRDQTEMRFLRERNEALERRFSEIDVRVGQSELTAIDSRIAQVKSHIATANDVIGKAISASKGEDAREAQAIKDDLDKELGRLEGIRRQAEAGIRQRVGAARQPQPNPAVARRAQKWISDNSDWFDPKLSDEDSSIAYAIEQHLYKEGRLDPTTDEYWDEVQRRIAKRLPHLELGSGDDSGDDREELRGGSRDRGRSHGNRSNGKGDSKGGSRPPGGPRFSTGGQQRRLGKNQVYVSPERVEAMKAAGVWEDPALRAKFLKSYQRYDRDAGTRSRA